MAEGAEPQRHVVVFDCNVYLDVANLLGPPFTWEKFATEAARTAKLALPHRDNRAYDSLRAIAACTSGRFAGNETLEVWTNAHIDKIVRGKAKQSTDPDPETGYRGLGWDSDDAHSLVTDLIHELLSMSSGGTLGDGHYPDGNPPLDYEDGMVYGACRSITAEDPLVQAYCVTGDHGFVKAQHDGRLDGHSRVLSPWKFVALVRTARTQYSIRNMRP